MKPPVRILHLDDSSRDAAMVAEILQAAGGPWEIIQTADRLQFAAALEQSRFDLILCDFNLLDFDGVSALKWVREKCPETPVIIVSGAIDPDEAVKCLHAGAADYLSKHKLERLPSAVHRALDQHERPQAEAAVREREASIEDIAERKRVAEALAESEERFRLFMDNSPTIAWVKDEQGRYTYLSKTFEDRFGVRFENWRDKTDAELWPPETAEEFRKHDLEVLENDRPLVVIENTKNPDGSFCHWLISKFPFRDGAGHRFVGGIGLDITERMRVAEALAESEERFRLFMDNSPTLAWIKDEQGRYTYLSKTYEERHGVRLEDWRGKTGAEVWPSETAEEFRKNDLAVLESGHAMVVIEKTKNPDGTLCHWLNSKFPFRDGAGHRFVAGIGLDITERTRAAGALAESEERFRQLAEQSSEVFWFVGLNPERTLYVSPAVETVWGLPPERFYEDTGAWLAAIHPDDEARVHQTYEAALSGRAPRAEAEYRVVRPDGAVRWVVENVTPIRNAAGEIVRIGGVAKDITERMRIEARVHEQAALLDESQDAIYVRDLEQRITYWSKGAERLYGWTEEEVLSKRADELFSHDSTPLHQESRRLILEKGDWMGEFNQISRSGRKFIVESRRTLLRDEQGNPKSILVINSDITTRKQVENQLFRTQRLESIGTLAGGVAHDLNNALAPILMATGLLRIKYPGAPEIIDTVETSARRGAAMVRQLLTFAKGVEGARLLVQPGHLIKEMEKMIKSTFPKNIELRASCGKKIQTILGDATQLHQVLLNLCVNARDAMPEGGTLTLEAENVEIEGTDVSFVPEGRPGPHVVLRVSDTGAGIPPEILERIFEPFFSTKGPDTGTGLGLSTAVGIVKSHGGIIRVQSTPGHGSTFNVYLPVSDDLPLDASSATQSGVLPQVASTFRGQGETILVVDDEATVREMACSVLNALNFQVITAADGFEALIQAAEHRTELHAMITDLHMPHMDGTALVRAIKRMLPEIGIIVSSGRLEPEEAVEIRALGVNALLDKPFSQERLIEALKTLFPK